MRFRLPFFSPFRAVFTIGFVFLMMTLAHSEGLMVRLVPVDAGKMAIAPFEDIRDWNSDPALVDTAWTYCVGAPGGIGFDDSGDYNEHITLNIGPTMQGRQNTCYIRAKFDLNSTLKKELDYLAIGIRFDDGFIAYLNGERIMAENAPQNPYWRATASQPHEAQSMVWYDVSEHIDKLKSGENLFAVHGMNVSGSSPDFLIQFELVARKNYQNNFVSDLPIIKIATDGNISVNANTVRQGQIESISNGTGNDHHLDDAANDYSGRLSITQQATIYDYPKNHYLITLTDEQGAAKNASLLGLPEGDEWILYAPYNDKTLLRTVLMGELAFQMGRTHQPKLCHLFLNDDYLGLYVLLEKINRNPNRIDLPEPGNSGDELTGGYMLMLNKNRVAPGFDSPIKPFFSAQHPVRYLYNFPDDAALTTEQKGYIQGFINGFEADVVNSIDIASAVDYFLLNEVSKNVDAYRDQTVLIKNRDSSNAKLVIRNPIDFNNACGNTQAYNGKSVQGWQLDYLSTPANMSADSMLVPLWWKQLFADATFTRALYKRWETLHEDVLNDSFVFEKLDSLYNLLEDDGILNFERWPVAGKPIEPYGAIGDTYDEDFDYFYLWMVDRIDWMAEAMDEFITSVAFAENAARTFDLEQNYPNPFNPQTTISYRVPQHSHVVLKVYDIRGAQMAELVNTAQSAGQYTIEWDASGFPSGVYLYELRAGDFKQIKRMLLMR